MATSEEDPESCLDECIRLEKVVCATGTAWGLLASQPLLVLVAFWMLRHCLYFFLAFLVATRGGQVGVVALGVFILYVHLHKIALFLRTNPPESVSPPPSKEAAEEDKL